MGNEHSNLRFDFAYNMSKTSLILTISALLAFVGCQTKSPEANIDRVSNSTTANSTNQTVAAAVPQAESSEGAAKTISFETPDGVKIVGTFYAAATENSAAVLMLHQFGGSRSDYKDLASQFQSSGVAVLAIDGRGFGESTKKVDGSRVAAGQSSEAVIGMKSDVAAAVKFLSEQRNVDKKRIGIVGASYGSSLAIIHAADNAEIKSVALLSPGTNYFGTLPTEPAIEKYGARPILIVAAEDDGESVTASRRLDKLAAGHKHQLQIYPKGGHGTAILKGGVGLEKLLLEFFGQNL